MNTYPFIDLFLKMPLYKSITLDKFDDIVSELNRNDRFQFDCYCTECDKEVTFRLFSSDFIAKGPISPDYILLEYNLRKTPGGIHFACQRNPIHIYSYYFLISDSVLTKIGQSPSMADMEIPGIQKYQKLLNKDYKDFSKAIGLHSHGIGAGSFVYLRRIFENLIEDIHKEFQHETDWDEDLYQSSRMDKKIKLLRDRLPDILVENRSLYGIMSKGIHELSESECLGLFPDVKLGIELILDEKLHHLEKQTKRKAFSNFVSTTVAELKE